MSDCPSEEELDAYRNEELSTTQYRSITTHIAECEVCAATLQECKTLYESLGGAIVRPRASDELFNSVRRRIEVHEKHRQRLQISIVLLVSMGACLFGVNRLNNFSDPTITKQEKASITARHTDVLTDQGFASDQQTKDRVVVTTGADAIALPVESGDVDVSIYFVYPTVQSESGDESSLDAGKPTSIVRSQS